MLKIKLERISRDGKDYIVFLDREKSFRFTNKRKAEDFLRQVNKDVNEAYLFISEEYLVLETMYRYSFAFMPDHETRFAIENSLSFLRNRLDALLIFKNTKNKNYFIVKGLEMMLLELLTVYSLYGKIFISRNDVHSRKRCDLRIHVISLYSAEFAEFEKKLMVEKIEIDVQRNTNLRIA